jgi:hypothetical protein
MSSMTSDEIRGASAFVARDFQRQSKRNPSRCQRSTVSGFTSSSASRHLGRAAASTDQAALMRLENSSLHLPCRNDKLLAQTRERRFTEASSDWDLYQTC